MQGSENVLKETGTLCVLCGCTYWLWMGPGVAQKGITGAAYRAIISLNCSGGCAEELLLNQQHFQFLQVVHGYGLSVTYIMMPPANVSF